MEIVTVKDKPLLKKIMQAIGSRKQKCILAPAKTEVRLSNTYWDGGSRSSYFLIDLKSNTAKQLASYAPPQFGGPKEDPIQGIEKGYAVVDAGVFCGKPATPIIHLHPAEEMD